MPRGSGAKLKTKPQRGVLMRVRFPLLPVPRIPLTGAQPQKIQFGPWFRLVDPLKSGWSFQAPPERLPGGAEKGFEPVSSP